MYTCNGNAELPSLGVEEFHEIPAGLVPCAVNGDPGSYCERLEQFVREQGVTLEHSADIAPAKGISEGGKIKLLPRQAPAEIVARWRMK